MKSSLTETAEGPRNSTEFGVVAIGVESDRFIAMATSISRRFELASVVCPDIYEGIAELSKSPAKRGLVVGRLEQLSKEKGHLFEKAAQAGWECCCLAKKLSGSARNQAIRAMKLGVIVINDPRQLEEVLMRLLKPVSSGAIAAGQHRSNDMPKVQQDE